MRQRLTGVLCEEHCRDLERLPELMEAGTVTPSIDRTYLLAHVPEAVRHVAVGQARGKVAITI
jgi:NADPH:quinone reductase-like Zn-dependent oxidoreductase